MTNFIFGRAGSGKSTQIYKRAAQSLANNRRTFLIVPEQQAVDAESRMADLLDESTGSSLNLEILNFRRLCNRVFRQYGGLSYNYITDAGRSLLMWKALTELSDNLKEYGGKIDKSRVDLMLAAISEFKAYRVSPSALLHSLDKLPDNSPLADKLSDLALIYADYVSLVALTADDDADDLTKAAEKIGQHCFFEGADVYFDSFNGYTPQEFEIIRLAAKQSNSLTISLTLGEGVPFENQSETARILKRLVGDFTEQYLTDDLRHSSDSLRFLEKNLWQNSVSSQIEPSDITLVECPEQFSECEAVAADILKRVRGGASFRDFAVVMRGTDRYDGIIDLTLEKYGIPCFFSKRTVLSEKSLVRLIFSSYSIITNGFSTTDIITLIKTGLTDLSPDESAMLIRYAERWRIRGRRLWTSPFKLNPKGWQSEPDDEAANQLAMLNLSREKLISPLIKLANSLTKPLTVRDHAAALYNYLLDLNIPAKLDLRAKSAEPSEAAELVQLWSVTVDSLDELVAVIPDLETDADTFVKLLSIVFDSVDIGRIPASVDAVTVGDASLLRASAKHLYIIGANEGIFPASPDGGGVFTDSDREKLSELGISLSGGGEYRAADERFTFYRALTVPSESVTISWSTADLSGKSMRPSLGALRLKKLFPEIKTVKYSDLALIDRLEGRPKLIEYAAEASGTKLGKAITDYLSTDSELSKKLAKLSTPLTESEAKLSDETAQLIAGGNLALTQSRLDSYVLCKFSYYCKYILKLEESDPIDFDSADIGVFIHHILEMFVSTSDLQKVDIDSAVDALVDEYMQKIAGQSDDARLSHLFTKLRRSSKLLCRNIADEFSQSGFVPSFYELPIRFPTPGVETVAPLEVELGDGTRACIYGIADRVDTYRRDGKLYVRVIDYKTGSKEFSMEDISLGLNLQMLLYLFSLWKNGNKPGSALKKLAGDDEILPAGVLYFSANVPTVTLDAELPPTEVEELVSDKLTRKGLLLDDREVLGAMEQELGGHFLPVRVKKDGSFQRSDALKTLEDFGSLLHSIETTIREIGGEMKRGRVDAKPMRTKKHNACKYCKMKPVCRLCNH